MTESTNFTSDLPSDPHFEENVCVCNKQCSKQSSVAPEESKTDEKQNFDELRELVTQSMKEIPKDDDFTIEKAFNTVLSIFNNQIEDLIRVGLEAFQRADSCETARQMLQEELDRRTSELERFRAADEKNSTAISNLLRALEQSRDQARESSRAAVNEAGLRAELATMVARRDEALAESEANKRKLTLVSDDLRQQKTKLARVTQEKMKLERDHRATLSLAKSLDSHTSSDADYYKRRVAEQNGQIQGLNAVIAEKNRQIEELRRQIERSLNQNRLANLQQGGSRCL